MTMIRVTTETVAQYFDGVMITCHDPEGKHTVPGWRCRACGWTIGTLGLPPAHECSGDKPSGGRDNDTTSS